jgi:hypothetical protein
MLSLNAISPSNPSVHQQESNHMSWTCSTCGEVHDELPLSFAADYPDNYANLDRDQRDSRAIIGSGQCVIDQKEFYIRGCLEIPIQGSDQIFLWGLWALLWADKTAHAPRSSIAPQSTPVCRWYRSRCRGDLPTSSDSRAGHPSTEVTSRTCSEPISSP